MKAILIGATGLVGSHILDELLEDNLYSEVKIFVRRSTGIVNPKLKEIINPMTDIEAIRNEITGDVLFNALGTTIKTAGSQKEQQRIDRDLPVSFARIASENGVKNIINVSSLGASLTGGFYLRTKAEMENGTEEYFPGAAYHFRPGLLTGERKEFRAGEKIAKGVMKILDPVFFGKTKRYRSMPADKLAKAMVGLSRKPDGRPHILFYDDIIACI
jgi:uncharacterized protein YbjT (DUF2867 family)